MRVETIDGILFDKMLRGGLECLSLHEKEINDLNVFPVPDGDTGTNMKETLAAGIHGARMESHLGDYLRGFNHGMLRGARGNSGVILSQLFRGVGLSLAEHETADRDELLAALELGCKTAYAAVVQPVEGTILTVARVGLERARKKLTPEGDVSELLDTYLAEMREVLLTTPDLLAVLKEAGVLDSGGCGIIAMAEGMAFTLARLEGASAPKGASGAMKLREARLRYDAKRRERERRKPFALLAVADGEGFAALFQGQGCDWVIPGGRTESPPVQAFLEAFEELNAQVIGVLPNNKNIHYSARQAAALWEEGRVEIIPTEDMVQCYFALACDLPDLPTEERLDNLRRGFDGVDTVYAAKASRTRRIGEVTAKIGEYVAFVNGALSCSGPRLTQTVTEALSRVEGLEDKEQMVVFTGRDLVPDCGVEEALAAAFPDLELSVLEGGQTGDAIIIGVL